MPKIDLFTGSLAGWHHKDGAPAQWLVNEDYTEVVPGAGDIFSDYKHGDGKLHVEFWIPPMLDVKGQDRGNSGVFLASLFEIQVLDSYENDTYFAGQCGSLYGLIEPTINASLPPGQWQTYDIDFRAPRAGKPGVISVAQNRVTIIDQKEFTRATESADTKDLDKPGSLRLQDHGCPVRFRNIWLET